MVEKVKTGISGLDELIGGGFPEGSTVLLSGSPGTGKTIFGLQFLYSGAKNNEPGIYLTIEESKDKILEQAKQFGWNIAELEKNRRLIINVMEKTDIITILDKLEKEIKEINAKRLVIDSLSMLSVFSRIYSDVDRAIFTESKGPLSLHGRELSRSEVYLIIKRINSMGLTTILISELPENGEYFSRDTISEFACDGVIVLKYTLIGREAGRHLMIQKMRFTKHSEEVHPIEISNNGIRIVGK